MSKEVVEESLRVNIKQFSQYFKKEHIVYTSLKWKSGSFLRLLIDGKNKTINLKYSIKNKPFDYDLRIEKKYINNGGYKYYFICPQCHKNVSVIYKAPSYNYFKCRKCSDLIYRQQKEHNKRFDMYKHLGSYGISAYYLDRAERTLSKIFNKYQI